MLSEPPDFLTMLRVLTDHEVEFIVVGGICAALHGASGITLDLDVVHRRAPENLDRLERALTALDAYFRHHPKRIAPTRSHLASPGHQLLMTRAGALDVLGTLVDDLSYDDLLPRSLMAPLELGLTVRLLTLDALIDIKRRTGRPKDRLAVDALERLRDEPGGLEGEPRPEEPER